METRKGKNHHLQYFVFAERSAVEDKSKKNSTGISMHVSPLTKMGSAGFEQTIFSVNRAACSQLVKYD